MSTPEASMTSSDSIDRKISDLKGMIRNIPDFPSEGIMFRDITPLLANPAGLSMAVDLMIEPYIGQEIDVVVGAESRGFIFGTAIAHALNTGFVPIRKPGKLPGETITQE